MTRRYYRSDEGERRRRFREAVNDLPWATPALHQGYAGLTKKQMLALRQVDLQNRVIDSATYPIGGRRRSPIRCALRPAASDVLRPWELSRSELKKAFLAIVRLDIARFLLTEWIGQAERLDWALSPYTVALSDTHIESTMMPSTFVPKAFQESRSLKFDLIGSMLLDRRQINFVVLVDPGGIDVRWFYSIFRVFHRWQRRPEFALKPRQIQNDFPVFVMIAANQTRVQQCLYLWRNAPGYQQRPSPFAITSYQFLSKEDGQRPWWNENGERRPLWNNTWGAAQVPPKPDRLSGKDPSHVSAFVSRATLPLSTAPTTRSLTILPRRNAVVQHQRTLTLHERELLNLIGYYPLLTPLDMSRLMHWRPSGVYRCLNHLSALCQKRDGGFFLSPTGIELTARQAGFAPQQYARLRQWQVRSVPAVTGKQLSLNMDPLSRRPRHNRIILDFMCGLANCESLTLISFDKEFPYVIPTQNSLFEIPGKTTVQHTIVVPDGTGVVRVHQPNKIEQSEFWLEVDCGTLHPTRLAWRLEKYYHASMGYAQLVGQLPRLLFVVDERAGDRRMWELLRLLKRLNDKYLRKLEAYVVRRDQLWEAHTISVSGKAQTVILHHRQVQKRPTRIIKTCNPAQRVWQCSGEPGLHFAFKGLS